MDIKQFKIIIDEIHDESIGEKAFIFGKKYFNNIYEMMYFFEIICKIQSDKDWENAIFEKVKKQGKNTKEGIIKKIASFASDIFYNCSDSLDNAVEDIFLDFRTELN